MSGLADKVAITAADYLAWEVDQIERHDFVDGEVYAMSGGEDRDAPLRATSTSPFANTCAARLAMCTLSACGCT